MATTKRKAADRLDNAYDCYAKDMGDGFNQPAWMEAYEYREEGYCLGEEAHDMPAEDRDDWIEGETYAFPESARYLIGCAADFRLAELAKADDAYPFTVADRVAA